MKEYEEGRGLGFYFKIASPWTFLVSNLLIEWRVELVSILGRLPGYMNVPRMHSAGPRCLISGT